MVQLPAEQQARLSLLEPYPRAPTLTLTLTLNLTLITDPNPDPYPDPKQARLTLLCGDAHDLADEMRQVRRIGRQIIGRTNYYRQLGRQTVRKIETDRPPVYITYMPIARPTSSSPIPRPSPLRATFLPTSRTVAARALRV